MKNIQEAMDAVRILAVGGAGCSIVEKICDQPDWQDNLYALNLDARLLNRSLIAKKIQLGARLTRGLGSGGNVSLGSQAALESQEAILRTMQGAELVIQVCGLGGGTGSGVSPVVAQLAKEQGAFLVSIVTCPFLFEGEERTVLAKETLEELRLISDLVLCFDNNLMEQLIDEDGGVLKAFDHLNQALGAVILSIPQMLYSHGLLRIGMDDLRQLSSEPQTVCQVGTATVDDATQTEEILTQLKKTLLLSEKSLSAVRSCILSFEVGSEVKLSAIEASVNAFRQYLGNDASLKLGIKVGMQQSTALKILSFVSVKETTDQSMVADECDIPEIAPIINSPIPKKIESIAPIVEVNEIEIEEAEIEEVEECLLVEQVEELIESELEDSDELERQGTNPFSLVQSSMKQDESQDEEELEEISLSSMIDSKEDEGDHDHVRYGQRTESTHTLDRGKFSSTRRLIVDGQDLDLPPALRNI